MLVHVTLVRHAHADWPLYLGRDFDRPLTPRGEETALATARAIARSGCQPTLLLTSPARRALQTATAIASELRLLPASVRPIDALYNARTGTLEAVLERVAREAMELILVAHNPGLTDLARQLSDDALRPALEPGAWCHVPLTISSDLLAYRN
jgi:phosphohistidine phosphatase